MSATWDFYRPSPPKFKAKTGGGLIVLVVLFILATENPKTKRSFFPRHSSPNLYSPPMEKPDQLRELFRMQKALNEQISMNNEERITLRYALEREVR